MDTKQTINITDFPDEILEKILIIFVGKCSMTDLLATRSVCNKWRSICNSESIIKNLKLSIKQRSFKFKTIEDWKVNEQIPFDIFDKYYEVNLSHTQTTDVSALGNVHTLDLSVCEKVTDVSTLGDVYTLDLSYCRQVRDVSALGNVHTLDLSFCSQVRDVSALGNVHTLDLRNTNVRDVSALDNVSVLH